MIKKSNVKIAVVLLLLLSASVYYLYRQETALGLVKPALILKVSTNLTDKGNPSINNVSFEQSAVPFFYKRVDSPANFPEIDVNARINKLNSIPASMWASVHYNGDNTYELKLYFKDGNEPKKGDILIMPIRITSHTGAVAYKTTAFYEWE